MASREFSFGTPTLHDLTVALAGAGSIDDVASEILERGATLVGAISAHLSVVIRPGWRRDFVGGALDEHPGRRSSASADRPIALDTPLSRALVTRREQVFESREQYRATFPHLARELERVSATTAITVPLRRADGDVIGALTYGFADSGPVSTVRRTTATQIAEQGALALDRAVLLHREREAARRAVRLHAAATELAAVVRTDNLAAALQHAGRDALGAARCMAYALEPDGALRLVSATDDDTSYPDNLAMGVASPVRDAVALSGPVLVESPAQFGARYGASAWPAESALLSLPLSVGARLVGVLHLSFEETKHFTPEERSLANGLAEQAALALDRSLLHEHAETQTQLVERERDRLVAITSSLQDGLFTSNAEGVILEVNNRFCEIVGFPRQDVIGARPPYPWWPNADEETTMRYLREVGRRARRLGAEPNEFDVAFQHPDGRRVIGLLSSAPLHGRSGEPVGAVATVKDVTARVYAERRLRALQTITGGLAAARTVDEVARLSVDVSVPALRADAGAFFLTRADASSIELRYSRADHEPGADNALNADALAGAAVTKAMRSGDIVTSDALDDETRASTLRAMGAGRAAWIPICSVENDSVACLALAFRHERPIAPDELSLYTAIGQQCGQAVDRALASEAEHWARVAAERSNERTRRLQRATAALTIASEPLDVARALTAHAGALVAADGVALFTVDEEMNELVLLDNGVVEASDLASLVVRLPLDSSLSLTDVVHTQEPVWIHDVDEWRARYPVGAETLGKGYAALIVLPLVAEGRSLGVLGMVFRNPVDLDEDDKSVLRTLSDLAAHALARAASYTAERTVARTLQQSLLPRLVEVTDRCKIAARYEPAVDQLEVGGDWYDALVLEPGRVAVMVGDVVGRGLSAAAAMGQLRSALDALAVRSDDPGVVLEMLDRFAERIDGGEAATAAFAILDTTRGSMRYACAGHPPPLLLEPGEPPRFLEQGRSWPLGIGRRDRPRGDAEVRLRPGSAVVFYTDGLVERRRIPLDERLATLAVAASAGPFDDPTVLCDRLFDTLLDDEPRDDVAVLSLVYDPALAECAQWVFPASPPRVRDARDLARRWLDGRGIFDPVAFDIVLACDEACANAVEHGSRSTTDNVELELRLDDADTVVVTVVDSGTWIPPRARDDRGQGLVLMEALMSSVEIEPSADGTKIRLTRTVDAEV